MPNWIHARHVEKERALILAKADWISGHGHFPRSGTLFPLFPPLHLHSTLFRVLTVAVHFESNERETMEEAWNQRVESSCSFEKQSISIWNFVLTSASSFYLSPFHSDSLLIFLYIRFNPFSPSLGWEGVGLFLSSLIRVIPRRPFTPFCPSLSFFLARHPLCLPFRRGYFTFL